MSSHVSCRILSDKTDRTRTLLIWLGGFGGLEREGCLERTLEVGPHGPLMVFIWTWKLLWLKFRTCLTCTCLVSIVQYFYFCHINRAGKFRRLRNSSLLRCSQTYSRKWRLFKKICWDVESICKICLNSLFFCLSKLFNTLFFYRDCLGLDWRPLWCVKCSQPRQAYVECFWMVDILWHIMTYSKIFKQFQTCVQCVLGPSHVVNKFLAPFTRVMTCVSIWHVSADAALMLQRCYGASFQAWTCENQGYTAAARRACILLPEIWQGTPGTNFFQLPTP